MADVVGSISDAELVGEIAAGSIHIHDYTIAVSDITGGHRLTVTKDSTTQTIDILDGVTPTFTINSNGELIVTY